MELELHSVVTTQNSVYTLPTLDTSPLPSFSGISPKCIKLNEESGLLEPDSEPTSEIDDAKELVLNSQTSTYLKLLKP